MKKYEKPELEEYDLRPEEMLARSCNCHAKRGSSHCEPALLWSHADPDPQ